MLRITAVSAGAVEYLVHGSGCVDHDRQAEDPEEGDPDGGAAYLQKAQHYGEPAGEWFGGGLGALGLPVESGRVASAEDVRAVFGQLRHPDSSEEDPQYLGRRPRNYKSASDRVADALAREPVEPTPERRREIELEAARAGARKAVAYYDFTFSAPKSVSVYWAALIAAGAEDEAAAVAEAHDQAVRIAAGYAEARVAYTRTGYHGRTVGGESVGKHEDVVGTAWTTWRHSTSRADEPQLHTHAALLNRVATADGHVGALDGHAFRAYKEAISTAYERALEHLVVEATSVAFALRPDGRAREIVGVDQELMAEASTRRGQVVERVAELVDAYTERHGHPPDPAARKAMADMATLDTRVVKGAEAGPAGVTSWGEARVDRLADMLDDVEAAARTARTGRVYDHDGHEVVAGLTDGQRAATLAAAVADVQARYAVWTIGNLVQAIDQRLAPTALPGVAPADRPGVLEGLAREALRADHVVRVSAPDPVEVPVELQRADGTSIYRRANGERYATLDQLCTEDWLVHVGCSTDASAVLGPELEMARVELTASSLSPDQVDAVVGILGSGRRADLLIGPAGAGKSHTVGTLARAWSSQLEGRVIGIATSQIATQNLAGDGLDAVNSSRFLRQFGAPENGMRREHLRETDLVVFDEAAMASTADLAAVTAVVARDGAKLVLTGDHHQLDAVGAGGMFAYLARTNGAFELTEVHRFVEPWEAEASLGLRAGDHEVLQTYADHGRVRSGTLEQIQDAATRGYIADTLAGSNSLLIVGTNAHAAELSSGIREDLIRLGRVGATTLATATDDQQISLGDRVQSRLNDRRLRVDPGADGTATPVTNRSLYTVVGRDPHSGHILARDDGGAVAHLPLGYVQEHLTLAYAVTGHAAQGVTVDTAHAIIDRDTTREALYPAATRGRASNLLYAVTERQPDAHDQERLRDLALEYLSDVLNRVAAQDAATYVRSRGEEDAASLAMVATQWDAVAGDFARDRYAARLRACLGGDQVDHVTAEPGYRRLLTALRETEMAGHDISAVLDAAITDRSLGDAKSVSDVLRWRVHGEAARRSPEQNVDPRDWTTFAPPLDGPVGQFAQELAVLATDRQDELGRRTAELAPSWATTHLGEVPDGDSADRAEWERRAGVAATYREMHAIPDEQSSLGPAPSREHEFHRKLWVQAHEALGGPRDAVDYGALPDAELYGMRERWRRDQEWAPAWVADTLRTTAENAYEQRVEAYMLQAERDALPADHPRRLERGTAAERAFIDADELEGLTGELSEAHESRQRWSTSTADVAEAARQSAAELLARGLPADRDPDPQPTPEDTDAAVHEPEGAVGEASVEERSTGEPVAAQSVDVEPTSSAQAERDAVPPLQPTPEVAPAELGLAARRAKEPAANEERDDRGPIDDGDPQAGAHEELLIAQRQAAERDAHRRGLAEQSVVATQLEEPELDEERVRRDQPEIDREPDGTDEEAGIDRDDEL
jgi:conjugative relaxase-like TrwC/TraI family protein